MSKIKAVEGIRGAACFMVVLSHLSLTFFPYLHAFEGKAGADNPIQLLIHNSPFGFMYSGSSAVYIFFVLSGYILTYVAITNDKNYLFAMVLKRYPRLMIPSLVSCVLAYFCFVFFNVDKGMLSAWINNYGNFDYSFFGAISSGLWESFFIGESSYNLVLWTMKIELFGSLLIFAMCWMRHVRYLAILDSVLVLILSILILAKILLPPFGLGLIAFVAGHFFYLYGINLKKIYAVPIFLAGLYFAGTHYESYAYGIIKSILISKPYGLASLPYELANFFSGLLIVYSIIYCKEINKFFSKRLLVYMGKISFSAYLIHLPIISTVGIILFNSARMIMSYELSAILSSVAVIFIIYIAASFYYNYIDRQGMILSKKFQGAIVVAFNSLAAKIPIRKHA